ncbi:biotin--[acetyl-CoA-carboxylase] ligase [Desulfitobacterium metallireducens]|uniref:Bifunctional ligase/repressor BirA n=1 Tax=Desulfitobacterium metallireducens DSM 15288 TaxID=871968 RepID=W0E4I3_9FIRM|nr:biotin--[acetyl-CoA-carboxylase] ligase [Desulfitobacterium metallireducens]AHF05745.1 biotin-(acetyl-CoA-carboxylase) ligase BirA [Desulfitobacterium metallireducens DSM 15288]
MRNEILNLLASQPGKYISGEAISQSLKITRAAVWKQIQALRESGYEIEAQTKSGYRLVKTPFSLEEWVLKRSLTTKTLGREIHCFGELSSTNDYAKVLIHQGVEDGAVVLARRQTSGRGRMQRVWESPEGGIWMTVILKPHLSLADAAKLTLSTGVALTHVCRELYGLDVQIKWPNDLVYQGKKIAGILGEVVGEWNAVQTLILGVGINANLEPKDLSPDIPATTLKELLGHPINLNDLVIAFLKSLEIEIKSLTEGDIEGLRARWLAYAAGIDKEVQVEQAGQGIKGILKGISSSGELILEVKGQEHLFSSGDVKLRSSEGYI